MDKSFTENTRVQVPVALHLCHLGYTYLDKIVPDNSRKTDKSVLIDASKLGEKYKDGNNQRTPLRDFEIEKIVETFIDKRPWRISPLSSRTTKSRGRTTRSPPGGIVDIKIEHVDISKAEFKGRIAAFERGMAGMSPEGAHLDKQISARFRKLMLIE